MKITSLPCLLKTLILLAVTVAIAGFEQEVACPSQEIFDLLGDSSLLLTQQLVGGIDNGNTTNVTRMMMSIELVYEGQAWLGFGFNRDGRMVGSTVVVGIPDEAEDEGTWNGSTTTEARRYFLGDKDLFNIRPITAGAKTYYTPPWPASGDDDDDDGGNGDEIWRRQLEVLPAEREQRELLVIEDSSITQNETHTTLQFRRPLEADPERGVAVSVHPDSLNTFIYAVGSSNTFGYHPLRGSHSFHFTSICTHGTLAPFSGTNVSRKSVRRFDGFG